MIISSHFMLTSTKDLAPARQARLRDFVRQSGVARVDDIGRELGISPATVRRDLQELESRGQLQRVHGGAVSVESRLEEPQFDDKAALAAREKNRIAEQAASLIKAGDTVYLDGGSTVLELARLLANRTDITVVTNSLRAAAELSGRGPRLILLGGELRRLSQTVVGPLTAALLEQLHFNLAFMGTMGLTDKEGPDHLGSRRKPSPNAWPCSEPSAWSC
jgi:DeoR family fructose operon transcriptional repressor